MEMYPNTSSFATNLTLQTPNTFRDASFSSYLNKSEENIIRNLTNQASDESVHANYRYFRKEPEEDGELDVFGAEKYFKEEIEDAEVKHEDQSDRRYGNIEDVEEFDDNLIVKRRIDQANMRTPSVRSNVSGDSRTGLLPRTIQPPGKIKTASKTRTFLGSFGCNCINSKSTRIKEKKLSYAKEISVSDQKTGNSSSKFAERKSRNESNDYFCFPALNLNSNNLTMNNLNTNHINSSSNLSNLKSGVLAGKGEGENNGGRLSLGKKLSMLRDWDVETPMEDEMYIPVAGMYNRGGRSGGGGGGDGDSDSSSDLFEIGSFSTTENSSFMAHRKSESNCYAPSEVSVDWSVVTASAADFSVVSDYEGFRSGGGGGGWRISGGNEEVLGSRYEQKRRNGLLSGCTSDKGVRVAGDEWKFSGGPVGGRRRLPESMEVGSMFRRE